MCHSRLAVCARVRAYYTTIKRLRRIRKYLLARRPSDLPFCVIQSAPTPRLHSCLLRELTGPKACRFIQILPSTLRTRSRSLYLITVPIYYVLLFLIFYNLSVNISIYTLTSTLRTGSRSSYIIVVDVHYTDNISVNLFIMMYFILSFCQCLQCNLQRQAEGGHRIGASF